MRAIVVIVANVIGEKSYQVALVHSDDVVEQESGNGLVRKGVSSLLHDPTAGGMPSDVEVNNPSDHG